MRNLKKKIVPVFAICLCLCLMTCLFSGCADNGKKIMTEAVEAFGNAKSVQVENTMNVDVKMQMYGQEVPFSSNLNLTTYSSLDPDIMHSDGTLIMNVFGSNSNVKVEHYIVNRDGDIGPLTYEKSFEDNSWRLSGSTANTTNIMTIVKNLLSQDIAFEKSDLTEDESKSFEGKNITKVSGTVTHEMLKELLGSAVLSNTLLTTELSENKDYDFSKFNPELVVYIDSDTKLPVRVYMDLQKNFQDLLDATPDSVSEGVPSDASTKMTVKSFTLSMDFSNYDNVDKIEVPQSVKEQALDIDKERQEETNTPPPEN
jgi:hypothetical protein